MLLDQRLKMSAPVAVIGPLTPILSGARDHAAGANQSRDSVAQAVEQGMIRTTVRVHRYHRVKLTGGAVAVEQFILVVRSASCVLGTAVIRDDMSIANHPHGCLELPFPTRHVSNPSIQRDMLCY